ncbi:hypothetical protein VaNZ11_010407 [Volvox africanus]|uniref:Uncharacterized protein n=1 Tax=Volvox africanus TaxID=51714 RepID=A0ABQ5SBG1_9CHLO|nr:hypothetical protein VaNZ11_010407 [Volvox africanus]
MGCIRIRLTQTWSSCSFWRWATVSGLRLLSELCRVDMTSLHGTLVREASVDNWDAFRPPQLASTLVQAAACGLTHLPAPTLLVQMPALLRRGMAAMSGMEPETLAKLVWSAGHYQPLISNALNAASATQTGAQAEKGGNTLVAGDPAGAPSLTVLSVLPEQELLDWWESEGVVEAASLGDLVLLLHGMARLGMQPGPVLMRRLLAAVMDSPDTLAQLLPQQLAILAWSALKLVEEPFKREWIDGLVLALQHHTRQARMQRRGTHLAAADSVEQELRVEQYGLESSERANALLEEGFQPPVVPTDVALALSSLAGLGGQLSPATRGEFQAYWRTAAHWDALPRQDRLVMSLLGYEPEVEDSSVS